MNEGAWIVAGAAVGAASGLLGGRIERSVQERRDFVGAASEWLAAAQGFVTAAVVDSSLAEPASGQIGALIQGLLDRFEDMIGKGRVESARSIVHGPYVAGVQRVADRMNLATTRLILLSPRRLVRRLEPHVIALSKAAQAPRDEEALRRWNEEALPAATRLLHHWSRPGWLRTLVSFGSALGWIVGRVRALGGRVRR